MIDLHCHILPDIDDGPSSPDESLTIARQAAADGIIAMVATPHVCNGVYCGSAPVIARKVEALNAELGRAGIHLTIYPGAEVQLVPGLTELLRSGAVCTINSSRYVLIELPPTFLPETAKDEFFALRINGFIPILAHPERHPQIKNNLAFLEELVQMGTLCQLTAQSLTGEFGTTAQGMAEKMIENDLAHILATDSHSSKWRKPVLSSALDRAARLLHSREEALQMVDGLPRAIVDDREFAVKIPGLRKEHLSVNSEQPRRRSFFRSMFSAAH
jgi:protein-tyrosine phosphatase